MDTTAILFILGCAVVALALGFFLLAFEVLAIRRNQRASVSLQLYQQLQNPAMEAALAQIRQLRVVAHNGDLPQLPQQQWAALTETDRFFSYVGDLVRQGIADDSVFSLMGPTICEVWHAASPLRHVMRTKGQSGQPDQFDWLYEQWLNYDHWQQTNAQVALKG